MDIYLKQFTNLNTNKNVKVWTERTKFCAPHKPLVLLSVLDRFAEGAYTTNFIKFDTDLSELFAIYWQLVMPPEWRGNIAMPLFHLRSEPFWHLLPRPGYEQMVAQSNSITSITKLCQMVFGAKIDPTLFAALQNSVQRDTFRHLLIERYFSSDLHQPLLEQGSVNLNAYQYSQTLLEQVKLPTLREVAPAYGSPQVRDQGFKRTMRRVYDDRCALCGIRVVMDDGQTIVVGAHIIPWSKTHNDDPRNGLALCRLCHWSFDCGLLTVTTDYRVKTAPQLSRYGNMPAHLATLEARDIIRPIDNDYLPAQESLKWHVEYIFLKD